MRRFKLGRMVQFTENGNHYVGNVMTTVAGYEDFLVDGCDRQIRLTPALPGDELVIVETARLSDYPAEPIPEPTNTGRQP